MEDFGYIKKMDNLSIYDTIAVILNIILDIAYPSIGIIVLMVIPFTKKFILSVINSIINNKILNLSIIDWIAVIVFIFIIFIMLHFYIRSVYMITQLVFGKLCAIEFANGSVGYVKYTKARELFHTQMMVEIYDQLEELSSYIKGEYDKQDELQE